jgi:hypothetical protein
MFIWSNVMHPGLALIFFLVGLVFVAYSFASAFRGMGRGLEPPPRPSGGRPPPGPGRHGPPGAEGQEHSPMRFLNDVCFRETAGGKGPPAHLFRAPAGWQCPHAGCRAPNHTHARFCRMCGRPRP